MTLVERVDETVALLKQRFGVDLNTLMPAGMDLGEKVLWMNGFLQGAVVQAQCFLKQEITRRESYRKED